MTRPAARQHSAQKEHAAAEAKVGTAGRHDLIIGMVLLVLAPFQLAAGVLVLLRRAKPFVLTAAGMSAVALLGVMMADHFTRHGLITLGALLLAFVSIVLTRPRPYPRTT